MQVSGASCSHLFISNGIAFRSLFIFSLYNGVTDHFAVPSRILVHHAGRFFNFWQSTVVQTTDMCPQFIVVSLLLPTELPYLACLLWQERLYYGNWFSTRYAWCIANGGTANLTSAWYPYCIVVQIPEHTSVLRCKPLDRPCPFWQAWYISAPTVGFLGLLISLPKGGLCIDRGFPGKQNRELNSLNHRQLWLSPLPYRGSFRGGW